MRRVSAITAALALLGLCVFAQATTSIDTVRVGDQGNVGDYRYGSA